MILTGDQNQANTQPEGKEIVSNDRLINRDERAVPKKELRHTWKRFITERNPNFLEVFISVENFDELTPWDINYIIGQYMDKYEFFAEDSRKQFLEYFKILET